MLKLSAELSWPWLVTLLNLTDCVAEQLLCPFHPSSHPHTQAVADRGAHLPLRLWRVTPLNLDVRLRGPLGTRALTFSSLSGVLAGLPGSSSSVTILDREPMRCTQHACVS